MKSDVARAPFLVCVRVLCCLLSALPSPAVAGSPSQLSTAVHSGDLQNPITDQRLHTCIQETARAMGLSDRPLPHILVLQLSADSAERLGIHHSHFFRNTGQEDPVLLYEVWLTSPSGMLELAQVVENILEQHFDLHYTLPERTAIVRRVANYLTGTVSVKTLDAK